MCVWWWCVRSGSSCWERFVEIISAGWRRRWSSGVHEGWIRWPFPSSSSIQLSTGFFHGGWKNETSLCLCNWSRQRSQFCLNMVQIEWSRSLLSLGLMRLRIDKGPLLMIPSLASNAPSDPAQTSMSCAAALISLLPILFTFSQKTNIFFFFFCSHQIFHTYIKMAETRTPNKLYATHPKNYGKGSRQCRMSGRKGGMGLIRKYGIDMKRQAFRENAIAMGWSKYS